MDSVSKNWKLNPLLIVAAVLLLLLHILAGYGVLKQNSATLEEAAGYNTIARNMSEHGAYSGEFTPPLVPEAKRTPGYPALVAAIFLMTGGSIAAVMVVQAVCYAGIMYLVYLLARRVMAQDWAIGCAFLAGFSPTFIITSKLLYTETVGVFLLLWAIYLLLVADGWKRLVWSALLLDLAILVRPSVLILILPMLIYYYVRRQQYKFGPAALAMWLVVSLLGTAGWVVRNYVVFGTAQWSSLPAIQTYNYEAKTAAAIYWSRTHGQLGLSGMYKRQYPMPGSYWAEVNRKHGAPSWLYANNDSPQSSAWQNEPVVPLVNGARMNGFEQAKYYKRIGSAIIKDHPIDWALGVVFGIARFWAPPFLTVYPMTVPENAPSAGKYLFILVSVAYWAVMVVGGLWGLIRAWKRPELCALAGLVGGIILLSNLAVLSQGLWRYRMGIEPLLAIFATYALCEWTTRRTKPLPKPV